MDSIFSKDYLEKYQICEWGYVENLIPVSLEKYHEWVEKDLHLPLEYLADERKEKRKSLKEYWPDCESSIVFLFTYQKSSFSLKHFYKNNSNWNGLKLAAFTMGFKGYDYHYLLKESLLEISGDLKKKYPNLEIKITLDTHPVLERDLGYRAGLGWYGKNSMLINKTHGSFNIIGSLLLNQKLPLNEKKMDTDHCGQCTRCVDACPTNAIDSDSRTIVAKDCISTFTIEEFKMDTQASRNMDLSSGFIFGCDICQDVCPWNIRLEKRNVDRDLQLLNPLIIDSFLTKSIDELNNDLNLSTEGEFRRKFKKTSFERSGRRGLLKNILFYLQRN